VRGICTCEGKVEFISPANFQMSMAKGIYCICHITVQGGEQRGIDCAANSWLNLVGRKKR